ncbi:uncharacterized protein V1516DRAFT_633882 [Lipomyces oligophaga]|uniref:uncharacterized protein n=1 Tax=Lipomyces oligophaga TaxID=45792 RepID=UPI0034CFFDD6
MDKSDNASELSSPPVSDDQELQEPDGPLSPSESISSGVSSDTYGSVAGSPGMNDDSLDQVSLCKWEDCFKEFGNMDSLVQHIHDEHVGNRRPKYSCEWLDCPRRGLSQTSRFALVAHMRSHTGEKPFFCNVPECDRSFTRSDALSKHIRTVHEEPARESQAARMDDPPLMSDATVRAYRQVLRTHRASERARYLGKPDLTLVDAPEDDEYHKEPEFEADEEEKSPQALARYLKRKLSWADDVNRELTSRLAEVRRKRKELWLSKELLLQKLLINELGAEEAAKIVH